jgi:hypothetical protein
MLSKQDLDYGFTQDDVEELMDYWDEWFQKSTEQDGEE